ncbi:MAG TPA: hypothetical protein VGR63_07230 [Casimicrobiaceae bacterium]|nr:hypothetical protein [Casimicrobiaceae bacterium]
MSATRTARKALPRQASPAPNPRNRASPRARAPRPRDSGDALANANVMIATPAYGGAVQLSYVRSLLDFAAAGIRFTLVGIANESLVTRARNALLSTFHARRDYTHLCFLDADVGLSAAALARMLAAGKDVIGAPVPLKGRGPRGERIFNVGRSVGEAGALVLCERIGTAALLLSRRAVDALVREASRHGGVYQPMSTLVGDPGVDVHYDVFRTGVVDGEYLSEDFWACATLRRLGFAIHVDPAIVTTHHGTLGV